MLSTVPITVVSVADSGVGTLRAAITQANANTANQYAITITADGTIDLISALPDLANNITISGPGASNLTVQRDSTAPDFSVFTVNSSEIVGISGMTISGGNASNGGGIYNNGTLTVNNCTFTDNAAFYGGGIYINTGSATVTGSTFTDNTGSAIHNETALTVVDSTFIGNSSSQDGGGISNFGWWLSVSGSTFTDNSATNNSGGGILSGFYASVTVSNSTFSDNSATGNGGGIYSDYYLTVTGSTFSGNSAQNGGGIENNGTVTAVNSTFTDNAATADGGGINNTGLEVSNGTVTLTNSTVYGNSATAGGGIYSDVTGTSLALSNSIVANNTGDDIYGMITSPSAYNLIDNGSGITNLTQLNPSNLIGTTANPLNPGLGPLANNGGPTQTMALLPDSPAINAGSNALAVDANGNPLITDQRGIGFPRIVNGTVDIGAYESTYGSQPQTLSFPPISTQTYGVAPITLTATATSNLTSELYGNLRTSYHLRKCPDNHRRGIVDVEADQAGNATYASAIPVDDSFTVNPGPVTTLADDPSGSIPGYTTLRDAITEANTGPTRSVDITFAVDGTIDLTQALPNLANNISIDGPGASNLTVQRDPNAQLIFLSSL